MSDAFDALDDAKPLGQGKPKPGNGDYVVEIIDLLVKDSNIIAEWKIVGLNEAGGSSPVGFESSTVRSTKTLGWENYFMTWLLAVIGQDPTDPAIKQTVRPYLKYLCKAAASKSAVKTPDGKTIEPSAIIGRKARVIVSDGPTPAEGKRYYPRETWLRV